MSAAVSSVDVDLRTAIETRLRRQLADRTPRDDEYGAEFARLWRLAAEHAVGGKLLRPLLLVDMHRALSDGRATGAEQETVLEVAALIEQLHYAFLLHDDIIDEDVRRRGTPNLIGLLDADAEHPSGGSGSRLHWARSSALLMGDLLLTSALLGFARVELSADRRTRLMTLVDTVVTTTIAGEHRDVGLGDGIIRPDLRTVLATTADKTAAYSFELPLRCAAILAGASAESEAALVEVGGRLGLAYQLQDDLLSVFGDPEIHGKDPYSDLREAKETTLIAYARMTNSWPQIDARFGAAELSAADGERLQRLLRECGAERYVQRLIDGQLAAAAESLAEAARLGTLPPSAAHCLNELVSRITGRRS